ncbi:MAG: YceI family protein [Bacteroidia bacterium]
MKYIAFFFAFAALGLKAQVYQTKTGSITFVNTAATGSFEAVNNQVVAALSAENGTVQFRVPVNSFQFKKELMQQHFQENYMETATYPNASFSGKLVDAAAVNFTRPGTYNVKVKGDMTMHGVSKAIEVPGQIVVSASGVTLKANFDVLCSDYSINIPRNNASSVSNSVAVSVNCSLTPRS